jgi:methylphosphotriester-DNA--protein-cysteine methyltransferase
LCTITNVTRRAPFTDLASLKAWLAELRPADRVRIARLIADARTRAEMVRLADTEIYERTRDATNADVAADLGLSERIVKRAINEYRKKTGAEGKPPGRRKATE